MTEHNQDAGKMIPPAPPADSGPLEAWVYPTGDGAGEFAVLAIDAAESKRGRITELRPRAYGLVVAPSHYRPIKGMTSGWLSTILRFSICNTCEKREWRCGEGCTVRAFADEISELLTGIETRYSTESTLATQPTDAGQQSRGCGGDHLPHNPATSASEVVP